MKSFASVFAFAFFVLGVALTIPAWAIGDAPTSEVKEAAPAAEKKADPKCEGVTLTGEKFLDMFYAIAMHGDLTDVPFIEKTLGTKFEVKYWDGHDNHGHKYKRADYTSKSILDAPIFVSFSVDVEREPDMDFGKKVMMRFSDSKCVPITADQFQKKFGGNFTIRRAVGFEGSAVKTKGGSKRLERIGKDGSNISISYDGTADSEYIYYPLIHQSWE